MKKTYRRTTRLWSLLLTCLLFFQVGLPLIAQPGAAIPSAADTDVASLPQNTVLSVESATNDLDWDGNIPRSDVPAILSYEEALTEEFLRRAPERESGLNQLVFQKKDGTYQEYLFSFPVKYLDEDGRARDKSPALIQTAAGCYEARQNDARLEFGANASEGVRLTTEAITLTFTPRFSAVQQAENRISAASFPTLSAQAEAVEIQSAFTAEEVFSPAIAYALGTREEVAFQPSYTGMQIQLSLEAGGQSDTFAFLLETHGLTLQRQEETFVLLDETGKAVAVLGDFTDETGAAAPFTAAPLVEGESYLLVLSVERTGAPAVLTASVSQIYDYIQDASLYSINQTAYGSSMHLFVGRLENVTGLGRAVIRANNWYLTETAYPGYVIDSARLVVRDVMGSNPEATIECREFTGNVWNESTATWNSANGTNYGDLLDAHAMSSSLSWECGYVFSYDITAMVRKWYYGTADWRKGVVLRGDNVCEASSTMIEKTLASAQYSTESYRPYFTVSYSIASTGPLDGVYEIVNLYSGKILGVDDERISSGTNVSVYTKTTSYVSLHHRWRVYEIGNGMYTIRPMHYTPAALDITGINVDILDIGTSDSSAPFYTQWKFIDSGNGTYYIQLCGNNSETLGLESNFTVSGVNVCAEVLDIYDTSQEWYLQRVTNTPESIRVYDAEDQLHLSNPSRTLQAGISSNLSNLNLKISVCTGGNIDGLSFYGSSSPCVSFSGYSANPTLTANYPGTATITGEAWTGSTYLGVNIQIVVPDEISGTYMLQNRKTLKMADIYNQIMDDETLIHQWEYHGGNTQRWIFNHLGEGYYSIKSANSSTPYYLGVKSESTENNVNIVLYSGNLTDGMKWKVQKTSGGAVKITSKLGEVNNRVLAVGSDASSTNGVPIQQQNYVNNTDYRDEWLLWTQAPVLVNLDVIYDMAYLTRYPNAVERISQQMLALQEKFFTEFEILVQWEAPEIFYSYADLNCSTSPTQHCTHVSDSQCANSPVSSNPAELLQTYHHKNLYNILARIPLPDTSSSVKMAYIGHQNCIQDVVETENGTVMTVHKSNPYFGICYPGLGLMAITNFSFFDSEQKTILHEFGHLYGTVDHHGIGGTPGSTETGTEYNRACIYGEDKEESYVMEDLLLCNGCKAMIRANRNMHVHG